MRSRPWMRSSDRPGSSPRPPRAGAAPWTILLAQSTGLRRFGRHVYQYVVAAAVILLLLSAVALSFGHQNAANDLALLAFFALVVGVALAILEPALTRRTQGRGPRERGQDEPSGAGGETGSSSGPKHE